MTAGLLLLAHGARDATWRAPFDLVAARVLGALPGRVVRLAFLELMAPDLAAAGGELAGAGCARVDIVPLFLGMGGHVRRDVPAQVAKLREEFAAVEWILHDAVGENPGVIAALAQAAVEAAAGSSAPPSGTDAHPSDATA